MRQPGDAYKGEQGTKSPPAQWHGGRNEHEAPQWSAPEAEYSVSDPETGLEDPVEDREQKEKKK